MDVELAEVRDFLASHAPYDELPEAVLAQLPARCSLSYARRGTLILRAGTPNDRLYVVRSGAVDITDEGQLVDRVEAGGSFGMSALIERAPTRYDVTAREDTLLITLPQADFDELIAGQPQVALHFAATHHRRIKAALSQLQQHHRGSAVLKTSVRDMVRMPPVTAGPGLSITEVAQIMATEGTSSLLVMEGERLVGIVTDRDLRRRVLAACVDPARPVAEIMTKDPITLPDVALAFEAMLEMTGHNIHHLPILGPDGKVTGLVTTSDLVRLEHSSPVYLVTDLQRQVDVDGVVGQARRIQGVVTQLVDEDATAEDIGRVATALNDAVTVRLIQLAEADLGPAPAAWAWAALGSAARDEQGLGGDQDHALVLADDADPDDPWWAALAEGVTAGLEAAGLPRCDGDVMATNPQWRMTVGRWREQFARWSHEPEPDAVLWAAIFYDMRALHGDASLVRTLREEVVPMAAGSERLLAHLTGQAARMRPPIGFFRGFVLEDAGEHRDTLDVKRGIAAIVQIARVHALRAGSTALSTSARLATARERGLISPETAADLLDAHELLSYLRIRHQAGQVRAGERPDNYLDPKALGSLDRRLLRDAFGIVRSAQQGLAARVPQVG
ncbi:DUF294 nucleotidyltransferase-like domain-containing protein [Ornithinimicrobium panacihumi]|uniref:DUF294 nucleotidyltransferase-like domain-containing protein n=1 Tax=Ornithinimicrobium panacihumi TaxID=2008449 RepID=UPI003F8A60F6